MYNMLTICSLYYKPKPTNIKGTFLREECSSIFCTKAGFNNSFEWHTEKEAIEEYGDIITERAVLIQSKDNYNQLAKDMPKYFTTNTPSFGENIIVKGLKNSEICVGDLFKIEGDHSTLLLEVSSPRKPCYKIDKKHKCPYGLKGIKRHSLTNGLSGWFCRVIEEGIITETDVLIRIRQPYPKWPITRICMTLYGKGDYKIMNACKPNWSDSKESLKELINIPALAYCEWKEELEELNNKYNQ